MELINYLIKECPFSIYRGKRYIEFRCLDILYTVSIDLATNVILVDYVGGDIVFTSILEDKEIFKRMTSII